MSMLRPDASFYPSPKAAMQAPPERLAYVALLNDGKNGHHDAMGVIDLDPASSQYGRIVGQVDFGRGDNELHHFGWNACSACLCPQAPHPHMERRYLIVPGIGSSRIYILDTKPDPRQPKIVKVIEPDEFMNKTGYMAPHTFHCGPDAIYGSALGSATGDGPGGIFLMDANTFELKGPWEKNRGPQQLAYDFWWHLGHDTMITSEWGTPNMVKDGVNPELLLAGKYGHKIHVWDLDKRHHVQEIDLGAEQQWVLELRPSHDPNQTYGFVSVGVSLKDLSSSIWMWYREEGKEGKWAIRKVIEIPAEPADPEQLPPLLKGFKAVPPLVTDINLSLDDRFLYVSCWGTGEFIQYDVSDPANPKKTGTVHLGGIVRRAAHPSHPTQALNGGPQMVEISRDGKRVYFTNSLYSPWDEQIYPDGLKSWMVKLDVDPKGGMKLDENSSSNSTVCERTRCGWMAEMRHPIPTATRRRNDALRAGLDRAVADAAPRRLPRNQPRDGVAVRGGTGDAGAERECGSKIACPDRAWSCAGHWQRSHDGCVSRRGASAPGGSLLRGRPLAGSRNLQPAAPLAPPVGPHAGGIPRPYHLVVSDGLRARSRFDGHTGVAGQQHGASAIPFVRAQPHVCGRQPASGRAGNGNPYGRLPCRHRPDCLGVLS